MRLRALAALAVLCPGGALHAQVSELSYDCGGTPVAVALAADAAAMTIGGESADLVLVPAEAGSRYVAPDDPGTWFQSQGAAARVSWRGTALPDCALVVGDPLAAVTPAALTGTSWRVMSLAGEAVDEGPEGRETTLAFAVDSTVSGRAGCNTYSADYALDGATLTVGPAALTRMACEDASMATEARFLALLASVETAGIDADGALVLTGSDGAIRARPD